MKTLLLISLLAVSSVTWGFTTDACDNGNAGANNPHCVGTAGANSVPEPSTVLLLAVGGIAGVLARRRGRAKTRDQVPADDRNDDGATDDLK